MDVKRIELMRETLRLRMLQSPLTDAVNFTKHLEHCFHTMWQNRYKSEKLLTERIADKTLKHVQ